MLRLVVLATPLLFALAVAPASAQPSSDQQTACRADFQKLCPGVLPGGGRPLACLSKQKNKLSPACLKVVESQGK